MTECGECGHVACLCESPTPGERAVLAAYAYPRVRIELDSDRHARETWARLDAAGFRAAITGRIVVAHGIRGEIFGALPPYLRIGAIFSEESEGE